MDFVINNAIHHQDFDIKNVSVIKRHINEEDKDDFISKYLNDESENIFLKYNNETVLFNVGSCVITDRNEIKINETILNSIMKRIEEYSDIKYKKLIESDSFELIDKFNNNFNLGDYAGYDDSCAYSIFIKNHPDNEVYVSIIDIRKFDMLDEIDDIVNDQYFMLKLEAIKFNNYICKQSKMLKILEYLDEVVDKPGNFGAVNGWKKINEVSSQK